MVQTEVHIDKLRYADILITTPDQTVALEVDGPTHFCLPLDVAGHQTLAGISPSQALAHGSTQGRDWFLAQQGIKVVSVSCFELELLGKQHRQRARNWLRDVLLQKLAAVPNLLSFSGQKQAEKAAV